MGIVYIMTNPAMPDLVKIGRTDGAIEVRAQQLSSVPGVPLPFEVFYAAEVDDSVGWERALHEAFDDRRLNPRREFFRISPDKPLAILKMANARVVTPEHDIADTEEEIEALDRERRRASKFTFESVPVPIGSLIQSVFDEQISAQVTGPKQILFRDQPHSLSSAALIVAHEKGHAWKAIQGPAYWKYEGKTLREWREEQDDSPD